MKKILSLLLVITVLAIGGSTMAFANDVPVLLTATASTLNVTVSENVTLTAVAGTEDLTVSALTVKNNAAIGTVEVTKLNAVAEDGWTLVEAATTDFDSMAANAKKLNLAYNGTDLMGEEIAVTGVEATPGQTASMQLTGKTGIVTNALTNEPVATVVVTIGLK
ncbi:MAG: hypothetical protein IJN72_10900 [Firmicutes bacterium]|nr:hypothetical protein [Bacillota bacterium]